MKAFFNVVKASLQKAALHKAVLIAVIFSAMAMTVHASGAGEQTGGTNSANLTWTLATHRGIGDYMEAVAYGNGKFVLSGWGHIQYSEDGATWTEVEIGENELFYDTNIWRVVYGGGKFVIIDHDQCKTAYSTDGVTWTAVNTIVSGDRIIGIAYGNGRFVRLGGAVWDNSGNVINPEGRILYSNLQE